MRWYGDVIDRSLDELVASRRARIVMVVAVVVEIAALFIGIAQR